MRVLLVAYASIVLLLFGLTAAGGVVLYRESGPDDAVEAATDRHAYSIVSWEMRHAPQKWIHELRHLFSDRSSSEEADVLSLYFADPNEKLEPAVEDILEGRVTTVLEEQGLALEPPLFGDLGLIFPPVDFELDSPPRVLAVSPRSRIELDRSFLLSSSLDVETAEGIERETEAADSNISALVAGTSGVATYPSVVSELAPYESLIDTVFHEWLHQYLIFFPLGSNYASSPEARTLNESVANIAGHELARLYFERYDRLDGDARTGLEPSPTQSDAFDFTNEMRDLRIRVETLLADGRIDEAETLMGEKRDEFEVRGVYIRRLNQAYFAFHGFYADTAGSIDPIGPKLETLLRKAGSPGEFVRSASGISSEDELDKLLVE